MTARWNIVLALGLTLLALAAGKSAQGEPSSSTGRGSAGCDATCDSGGGACNTGCKPWLGPGTGCLEEEPFFACCSKYFNDFCDTCESCHCRAEASVLYLQRSTPGSRAVLFDPNSGGDLFDASHLGFPYAAGPRASLTILDCEGWGFELNYFGVDGWSTTTDIPNSSLPSGSAILVVDKGAPLTLASAHFESISRLYSTEVNFRKPMFGNISFLAGFRWLELMDQYLAEGTSFTTRNTVSETILTHNHLYGFQIGADGALAQQADRWRINGFVKGGIFLNSADQATSLSDPGGRGSLAVNVDNQDSAAFFGEAGVVGYFQITKHLAASGGYQVMFVNGVAQPVNQLAGTNLATQTATIDASSGLFYKGATAGLELTW